MAPFDPIHWGHLRYLQEAALYARGCGASLVVTVAPDAVIRAKGREPFQSAWERARCLRTIRGVDHVFVGRLAEALVCLQPSILIKGKDWDGRLPALVVGICDQLDIKILYTDTQERTSSERLAWLMRSTASKP